MPLPNLSGKSYISTSPTFDSYQSGADSYREKVKEKIQNSPRQSATYSRSIDLSLTKETQFRPVSRTNNRTNNLERLKSALNDSSSRLKSARNRQLIFYNNNGELVADDTNSMITNNDNDLKREDHRKNNTRNRNFIDTSPLVSDDEFSFTNSDEPLQKSQPKQPPQPISRRNNNNNINDMSTFNASAANTPRDTSSLLKAPLITPRKSVLQKQQHQPQQNEENDFLSQYDPKNRSKMKSGLTNRSYDMVASRTTFHDDEEDDDDIIYQDASLLSSSSPPPAPPVPVPRKRDQPAYLTNNDEIRIKRNNSASLSKNKKIFI